MSVRIKVLIWVTSVSFVIGTTLFWLVEGGSTPACRTWATQSGGGS